jgi:predicted nucleotidyltransferase
MSFGDCGGSVMVSQRVLGEVVSRLVKRFKPTRIILFGSQARGTADDRSDVDLLVVCPVVGRKRDLMVAMDRALSGLGIARDVIVFTPDEFERDRHIPGTVSRPASLEGKVLYDSAA